MIYKLDTFRGTGLRTSCTWKFLPDDTTGLHKRFTKAFLFSKGYEIIYVSFVLVIAKFFAQFGKNMHGGVFHRLSK